MSKKSVNKSDLLGAIHKKLKGKYSKVACSEFLDATLESVIEGLAKAERVILVGFGTFYTSKRGSYMGHNPLNGKPLMVKASKLPKFRAGKRMKDAVNK